MKIRCFYLFFLKRYFFHIKKAAHLKSGFCIFLNVGLLLSSTNDSFQSFVCILGKKGRLIPHSCPDITVSIKFLQHLKRHFIGSTPPAILPKLIILCLNWMKEVLIYGQEKSKYFSLESV